MKGILTILGCGASLGVPAIACECSVCRSLDPKNKRLRTSALLEVDGKKVLIDAGPDFRQQALRQGIVHIDGIILTHIHFDHIAGIDDTRVFSFHHQKAVSLLLSESAFEEFRVKYAYFFHQHTTYIAKFEPEVVQMFPSNVEFAGLEFSLVNYYQGKTEVLGFIIGDLAYITDIKSFDERIFDSLKGIKTLVISALKNQTNEHHLSFDESIEFAKKIGAKKTFLTHLSHEVDYGSASMLLPPNVELCFDGLQLEFEYERK